MEYFSDGIETATFPCDHKFSFDECMTWNFNFDARVPCPTCYKETRTAIMSSEEATENNKLRARQLKAAIMDFEDMKRRAVRTLIDEAHVAPTEAQQRVDGVYEADPDIDLSDLPPPPDFDTGSLPPPELDGGRGARSVLFGGHDPEPTNKGERGALKWGNQECNEGTVAPIKPACTAGEGELGEAALLAVAAAEKPVDEEVFLTREQMEEQSTGPARSSGPKRDGGSSGPVRGDSGRGLRTMDSGKRKAALHAKKQARLSAVAGGA
jgi:hypothetical protein